MSRHMKKAHTKDHEKKYQCPLCGKGFIDITRYKLHMTSSHTDEKPFTCRYNCGHASKDPSNRNKHEKEKHGKKFGETKDNLNRNTDNTEITQCSQTVRN